MGRKTMPNREKVDHTNDVVWHRDISIDLILCDDLMLIIHLLGAIEMVVPIVLKGLINTVIDLFICHIDFMCPEAQVTETISLKFFSRSWKGHY
jgi:hypothetical protein